jgi:ribosome-associated toxin RatA of RatAB toxin-antitoxin module
VHTVHHATIAAPLERVFALARDVEAWPRLLRAYRSCRVLERTPGGLVFTMSGWIRGWPARWTAVQESRPHERRIAFRHVRGLTRGMTVEWRFEPSPDGVRVTLVHELAMRWPLVGRLVGDWIVGPVFIDYIARKTLRAVQARAETGARAPATARERR